MTYELIEIEMAIYPPGHRFCDAYYRDRDEYDGFWITPEVYSSKGYNPPRDPNFHWRTYQADPGDSIRDLYSHERERYFTGDFTEEDAVFDRWAVRLRFRYLKSGALYHDALHHQIEQQACDLGEREVFEPYIDEIIEALDPYIIQLHEGSVEALTVLTAWSAHWHSYYDAEGYKDADFEYFLEGIVKDIVLEKPGEHQSESA
jgi:hypothetical protein